MCKILQGAPDLLCCEWLGCSQAVLVGMLQGCTYTAQGSPNAGAAVSRSLHCTKVSAHISDHYKKTLGSSLQLVFTVGDTLYQQLMGVDDMTLATHPGQ